jgi:hypothetical protein
VVAILAVCDIVVYMYGWWNVKDLVGVGAETRTLIPKCARGSHVDL